MMMRRSPPKHRHDGTSPLPLSMDWSPPPRKWVGKQTVWPHDPRTGWSYCVTIPSWAVLAKSRDSDPVVFYRVQVGVQSSEGVTTVRVVMRRFNDFLKLFTDLRKAFLNKNLPPAPPKGLLRMKSRVMLEERRCSLEEWMIKLLSDIDISRSVAVASFLELEAAARSSFEDVNQQSSEANNPGNSMVSSLEFHPKSNLSVITGSTSITPDYGSDTAYETSEVGTPRLGRHISSEIGIDDLAMDDDLTSPMEKLVKYGMANIDEGLFMGEAILEQIGEFPKHKVRSIKQVNSLIGNNGNIPNTTFLDRDRITILSEIEHDKGSGHARKLSSESIGSDVSSLRGSEMSNTGILNSSEGSRSMETPQNQDTDFSGDGQVVLPLDQRHKLNRVLMTMQRRLVTATTDMEDLIARMNQEIAVKDYLSTKVKDLEVELETTKQKGKENLHQTMLIERERFTQMQWDMEELRRTSLEMEFKLKSQQNEKVHIDATNVFPAAEKNSLLQELDATKEKLQKLMKRHEELETKSKSDIKVLVKEVKSLRYSQTELKQELSQSIKEKSEAETLLQHETQRSVQANESRRKLLNECMTLHNRLLESNVNLLNEDGNKIDTSSSSLSDALGLLTTSDNSIGLLIAETQLLAQDNLNDRDAEKYNNNDDDTWSTDCELKKMLSDIFIENAKLRKQVNSVFRCALKTGMKSDEDLSLRNTTRDGEVLRLDEL